mmetsp:Transcript_16906/g.46667  ORF Transcript_16906/g.46667 Transcript_16906/m.46667 type:complete len:84 (+) Transcript_16906:1370-1621(+)
MPALGSVDGEHPARKKLLVWSSGTMLSAAGGSQNKEIILRHGEKESLPSWGEEEATLAISQERSLDHHLPSNSSPAISHEANL